MSEPKYVQSTFDKAFNRVINYLKSAELLVLSEFANQIDIRRANLSQIMRAERGLAKHKIDYAKFILTSKYNVSPQFLATNKGSYLAEPLPIASEEHPQYNELQKENEQLKIKVATQEERINGLLKLNETQEQLINSLKEQLKKVGQ